MQGSTRGHFVWEYVNELINMRKYYNSTTKVGRSNLVKRILDQGVIHLWGQRSRKGQQRSICLGMSYDYQTWSEEPLTRV